MRGQGKWSHWPESPPAPQGSLAESFKLNITPSCPHLPLLPSEDQAINTSLSPFSGPGLSQEEALLWAGHLQLEATGLGGPGSLTLVRATG